jgi:choline dehydrogenase
MQCSRSEATYTVRSSLALKENGSPDMHTYFLAYSLDTRYERDFSNAFNFKPEIIKDYYGKAKGLDSFLQMVTLNQAVGTGNLKLRSKDPFVQPLIDPKYLQNERDVKILVEGTYLLKILSLSTIFYN